ncbi:MAG: Trk system potassium transporter TrkA [Deltaproteobacteria bacterium]|nr:Trk system potassium transporter TrkA [Deltaproteobacteria bacterium]
MKKSESILIIGLGGVGYYLAKWLSHEGYAITAIENSPELVRRADGEIDARLILGDAMSFASWKNIRDEDTDYLIAVTDNDAVNITAALIADRCGIPNKIARVRSLELWEPDALLTEDDLNIDLLIRPGELTAQEIARLLKMRAGNVVIDIAEGQMQVMATRIDDDSEMAHRTLKDIGMSHDEFDFRIVAIARGIQTLIPSGDEQVLPQDYVFILAHRDNAHQVMALAGVTEDSGHRVMIVGGGLIGARVAELLEDELPVRLIERDEDRAEELSYRLSRTQCLHGDGSDADILCQAGLLDMNTIITATGDNETNIMTALLAKHLIRSQPGGESAARGKTIALVKREEYLVLAQAMGADIVLNRKVLAGNQILKHVRRGKLLSVAHLHGCEAEVVELVAESDSRITGKPLFEQTDMKDTMLIGGVRRYGEWEIAVGSTEIEAGDKCIGICASRHLPELQRWFRK